MPSSQSIDADDAKASFTRLHLRVGWWTLLFFATLGLGLESLHGFKVGWYLDVANETRREMWTLAHAHGTLVGLLNVAFGVTLFLLPALQGRCERASRLLLSATVLLPGGFFLGGVYIYGGDPGLGILLVPLGAGCLVLAVFFTARAASAFGRTAAAPGSEARKGKKPLRRDR